MWSPFEVLFAFAHLSSSTSLQHFAHMDLAVLLLGVSRSLGKFHGGLGGQFGLGKVVVSMMCLFSVDDI